MRIPARLATALVLAGAPAWLSNVSAAPVKAGRWMLRASGQTVLLLELHKDAHAKGGWAGVFVHPRHFSADPTFRVFSNVQGPATAEPIIAAVAHPDELDLTTRDSAGGLTHLVWKPSGSRGMVEFTDVHSSPIALAPAAANQRVADSWDKARTYSAMADQPEGLNQADNPEMTAMFNADQSDRQHMDEIDWNAIATHDEEHRVRTKALLAAGKLHSASDFYHAAFIFQHGQTPDDYLLAHTLAVVAAARGRADAAWIAAASLDRYLMSIGQKQIYGTQYMTPKGKPVTQEPYDRALISDALRGALGVPPIANQEKQRLSVQKDMDEMNKAHDAAAKK